MSPTPIFHSTGRPGFTAEISQHQDRVMARKLVRPVDVRFTSAECTVQTNEGLVHAHPGDAIITGAAGEHWRVSRSHFTQKYEPVMPTIDGQSGTYRSRPYQIMAVRMTEPFAVVLADGQSHLRGQARDWLVDYGDGSLGIVSAPIFDTTYEVLP